MHDMNYTTSRDHGFGFYEQLRVVYDMNDSRFYELRALGAMNNLWLWMIWTIFGHKAKAPIVMNNLGLWMTWITYGHELKALDAMNNLVLWLTWTNLGDSFPISVSTYSCPLNGPQQWCHLIRVQLVFLDCGPQKGVINKIYNLLHHVLG